MADSPLGRCDLHIIPTFPFQIPPSSFWIPRESFNRVKMKSFTAFFRDRDYEKGYKKALIPYTWRVHNLEIMAQSSTGVSLRSCHAGKEDTCLASSALGTTSPLWEGDHYLIRTVHVSLSRRWVTLLLTTPSEQPLRSHSIDFSLIGDEVTADVSPPDGADARMRWEKGGGDMQLTRCLVTPVHDPKAHNNKL